MMSRILRATAETVRQFSSTGICHEASRWLLKAVRVEPFLLTHEIVEKALLDELRLHYLHAHQIAVRAERDAVKAAGISWGAYQSFMKKHEKPIEEEKLIRVPPATKRISDS
jgi:hypothetical protein